MWLRSGIERDGLGVMDGGGECVGLSCKKQLGTPGDVQYCFLDECSFFLHYVTLRLDGLTILAASQCTSVPLAPRRIVHTRCKTRRTRVRLV